MQAGPGTGKTMKAAYGAVRHPYLQSPQAGEWLGAAVGVQSAVEGSSTLDLDWQSVLRGLLLTGPKKLDHKDPWSGVRRNLLHEPGLESIKEYRKIKAHQEGGV